MKGLDVIQPMDAPDIRFAHTDSMVTTTVFWFGVQGYEGVLADVWRTLCRDAKAVLEVGGNIGFYTVIGGRETLGQYTVVEPIPHIFQALLENLKLNGIDKIQAIEAAVVPGDKPSSVTLTVPQEGRGIPTGAFLKSGGEVTNRSSDYDVVVRGEPFAVLAANRDLIKIDAEGIEHALIASSIEQLRASRPTIVVEVLPGSVLLAEQIRRLAHLCSYRVLIVPAYRSNTLVEIDAEDFSAELPARHHSKDVILTHHPLSEFRTCRLPKASK